MSSLNGKLGFNYGDYNSSDGRSLTGSVTAPISTHFGAQLDGLYSHVGSTDFYGAGGHFFWRDSARGLIGFAAAGTHSSNVESYEAGIEAEYYFRWLTPGIYTGYSMIDYKTGASFIDTDRTAPFGTVYVGIYPLPDLLVRPSYTRKLNNNYYGVELEYTLCASNLALTAEGTRGDRGYEAAQIGLRYYFGGQKSLKARHREDDPSNLVPGNLTSVRVYQAEYVEKQKAYALILNNSNNSTGSGTTTSGGSLTVSGGPILIGGSAVLFPETSGGLIISGSGSVGIIPSTSGNTLPSGTGSISGGTNLIPSILGSGNLHLAADSPLYTNLTSGTFQFIQLTQPSITSSTTSP